MEFSIFQVALIAQAVVDAVLIAAAVYCVPRLKSYYRMVQVMTAESRVVPTDAKLISEWAEKRDTYKKGSPKWIAYTNRLKEVGYEK